MDQNKKIHWIIAASTFVISFLVYLKTIAPTTSFWDCGEFIACSYILGVPHPPGAPFYLLLGRIFTMLPIAADIGLRVNLVSALTSAITVMLTYLIIVRLVKIWRGNPKSFEDQFILYASGFIGAMAFAFTDTFWFNAVEAEVYAISMFFTAIIVWLILVWMEKSDTPGSEKYLLLIVYSIGLAIGVHLLNILALPAIALIVYFKERENKVNIFTTKSILVLLAATGGIMIVIYKGVVQGVPQLTKAFGLLSFPVIVVAVLIGVYYAIKNGRRLLSIGLASLLLVLIAYSTYTMIYIRSGQNPAIDENNPENAKNLVAYLNREQYGQWSTFPRRFPGIPLQYQYEQQNPNGNYATYQFSKQMDFMWKYQISKMYLRYFFWQFVGKGTTLGKDGYIIEIFSVKGLMGLPFLIGLIGMVHHFYRDWRRGLSVLALLILTGVAIVIYLNQEDPQPRERDYVYVGSYFAFALWVGMGITAVLEWIADAFRNNIKRRRLLFGVVTISMLVIVPINLLAHNYHTHDRTGNYVAYDYSYNLLHTCEKDAIVFTNGDNDTFPLWFLQNVYGIRQDVRVVNLSLLNTPWYIKQLKYEEPRVPISMSDKEIEALEPRAWEKQTISIPVPRYAQEEAMKDLGERRDLLGEDAEGVSEITFEMGPTLYGRGIRVQDWMVLNIIHSNKWRRPVYFAVTVSNDNKCNLHKYLRMDGLDFKLVTYPGENISKEHLKRNLFKVFQYRGLNDPNVYYNDNIRGLLQNYRAAFLRLTREYALEGKYDEMAEILDKMEEVLPEEVIPIEHDQIVMQIGQMYNMAKRPEEFITRLERVIERSPNNAEAYGWLVAMYTRENQKQKAVQVLQTWLERHPDDKQAMSRLSALQKEIEKDSSTTIDSLSQESKEDG